MPNLKAVNKTEFTKKSWKNISNFLFAAKDSTCPLGLSELPKAMSAVPLAFACTNDEYSIVAIHGLLPATNMYVLPDGKWGGIYIPNVYKIYPFSLAHVGSEKGDTAVLCVDTDSDLVTDDETEQPFFDEDLKPTQLILQMTESVFNIAADRQRSISIANSLCECGLLKPWEIEFKIGNITKKIEGLFCVDEIALNELSGDAYTKLRDAGAILPIYCQLLSMGRLPDLFQIIETNFGNQSLSESAAPEPNLYEVNSEGNISFDNL